MTSTTTNKASSGPSMAIEPVIPMETLNAQDNAEELEPPTEVVNATDAIVPVELTKLVQLKVASAAFCFFNAGVNDGSLGSLIPYILSSYNHTTSWMALPYGLSFFGWFLVAIGGGYARSTLGTGGVLLAGASLQFLAQALRFWLPPFGLFAVTFFIVALGQALQDSQANTYVATLRKAHRWLGVIHGSYALGGLVGPLIAAAIASTGGGASGNSGTTLTGGGTRWTKFYYVPLGIGAINILFCMYAFRDEIRFFSRRSTQLNNSQQRRSTLAINELRSTLRQKPVWLLSIFFFLYLGAAITAGGWVVEFLVVARHKPLAHVGYVSSAFYGGAAFGRLALAEPTFRLGEKRMLLIYGLASLALQIVFWRVPNLVVDIVAVALMGVLLGPSFATGVSVGAKLLPEELQPCGLALIFVTAQAGGSLFPAVTGVVAAQAGVKAIQPILVSLLAAMCVAWFAVPDPRRK